jgi:glycosyltransferase involved in cell wall biosynthesis
MSVRKKILIVITKGSPFGGAQRYVYDLATHLPADRFEAIVACGEGNSLIEKLNGVNIRTIQIPSLVREINIKKDWKAYKELRQVIKTEKPDVVHLNSSKAGFIGAFASLNTTTKTIFTAHNWGFNDKDRSTISRFVYYVAHYFTLLACDHVISVSQRTSHDIDWLPLVKDKIKVIYNGVGKLPFLTKKEAREFFGVDSKKTLLYSLSELHKNKGIDLAIRAIKLLPEDKKGEVVYCIAGTGEESENLEKLIFELGVEENVRLMGFVEQGFRYLPGADAFLMPSRTEAFPYSL